LDHALSLIRALVDKVLAGQCGRSTSFTRGMVGLPERLLRALLPQFDNPDTYRQQPDLDESLPNAAHRTG
jgi:hypothetical protein